MEEEGLAGDVEGNAGNEVQNEIEQQTLLSLNQPTYLHFRIGRQRQPTSKCTRFILAVFKVTFCLLGLWGHQVWNYIPRVLLSAIFIYQTAYVLSFVIDCPVFDCSFYQKRYLTPPNGPDVDGKDFFKTAIVFNALFSLAALVSYLVMIGCFIAATGKDSALVFPSESMKDIPRKDAYLLFVAFGFITVLCSVVFATFFMVASVFVGNGWYEAGVAAQLLALWASVNTCHVFAVSSFTLGKCTVQQNLAISNSNPLALEFVFSVIYYQLSRIPRFHEQLFVSLKCSRWRGQL